MTAQTIAPPPAAGVPPESLYPEVVKKPWYKAEFYATRPSLQHYTASRKDLVATANDLFDVVGSGKVKVSVSQTYPLAEAARAHQDLEARLTTGSTVLLPTTPTAF